MGGAKGGVAVFDWQVHLDCNLIIHVQNIIDNTFENIFTTMLCISSLCFT